MQFFSKRPWFPDSFEIGTLIPGFSNLSSGLLCSLRGPEKQGGDITRHWSLQSVFVEQISNFVTHLDLTRQSFFPNLREHTIRTKTKINHHGPGLLFRAKTSSSHYLDRKIDTHKQKRNRCEHPLRPQDGSFKALFLFSYIIDVEEKTTPYSLSLHHFLGAKFTGFWIRIFALFVLLFSPARRCDSRRVGHFRPPLTEHCDSRAMWR